MNQFVWGSYYPRDSFIHNLEACSKIFMLSVFAISFLFLHSWISVLIGIFAIVILYLLSKISLTLITSALRPLRYILIFVIILSGFSFNELYYNIATQGYGIVLYGGLCLSLPAFLGGVLNVIKMCMCVSVLSLISFTTPFLVMTQAITLFMRPLVVFGVSRNDIQLIVALIIGFIPRITSTAKDVLTAQKSRGAKFELGGINAMVSRLSTVVVPVFVGSIRLSERTGTALDARCYSENRKSLQSKSFNLKDCAIAGLMSVLIVLLPVLL